MEEETSQKTEPVIAEMNLERGNKKLRYMKVRIYSIPDANDSKPFIVKDIKGNEIELRLSEQVMAETIVWGKPRAETLERLRAENNSVKRR